jgi:hypothetical protein
MLWGWDVLELGPFVLDRSVVGHFVLGCFVGAPFSHVDFCVSFLNAVGSYETALKR